MEHRRYAETRPAAGTGGTLETVERGSVAWRAGLRPGDVVLAVDGRRVRDILDWQWLTGEPSFSVTIERGGRRREIEIERDGTALGVTFRDAVFDGVRECENACAFCFVAGLPTGLRPSLYVRDDDYRLSFLEQTFITLTNLYDDDVTRIVEQRLSPLYVSVHAVDPDVRRRLICPTIEDRALERLDELLEAGIEVHAQVVLVPGVNDGDVLSRTLAWLAARDGVRSVGLVPVGRTARHAAEKPSYRTPAQAREVLDAVAETQRRMRSERGSGWVYAADEFHLLAGSEVPPAEAYDGFPQYENGIGMVRAFADELAGSTDVSPRVGRGVLVTGTLFAPVLEHLLSAAGLDGRVRVLGVGNTLFGPSVTVAGLLGAADIVTAIRADGDDGPYIVPDVIVNSDGLTLDDIPAASLGELADAPVRIVPADAASLVHALAAYPG